MELEEYDYEINYVPGTKNVKADALSRNRSANEEQPPSKFEEKIYAVDNMTFLDEFREQQSSDDFIATAKAMCCRKQTDRSREAETSSETTAH